MNIPKTEMTNSRRQLREDSLRTGSAGTIVVEFGLVSRYRGKKDGKGRKLETVEGIKYSLVRYVPGLR